MAHKDTTTMSTGGLQATPELSLQETWPDLSNLLAARLCHDLASPLGAIGNGVELLEMMSGSVGPELDLVGASVRLATGRLRLFRFAFGPSQTGQIARVEELRALLRVHDETARFWTDCRIESDLPRDDVKLLLLGLMCLERALAWGGSVGIFATQDGYELRADAERISIDPALWAAMGTREMPPVPTAATIQFPLLMRHAKAQGFAVSCAYDATSVSLKLSAGSGQR
jgi:histidine phosphotransferase ChpT